MAGYQLENGTVLTDADIERISKEFESGTWKGRLENIHQDPAAVSSEPLVSVTVKFPASMVEAIDKKTKNRSDFIRRCVAASL